MMVSSTRKAAPSSADALFMLSFLLIGADRWSFAVGGLTIRIANITLLFCFFGWIYTFRYRQNLKNLIITLPFLIAIILSGILTISFSATLGYIIWSAYNILITFFVAFSWGFSNDQDYIIKRTRQIMVVMASLVFLQFAFGLLRVSIPFLYTNFHILPRPAIWFYEPSYLATFLVTYLTIFLFLAIRRNAEKADIIMCVIIFGAMVFTTSTTGFIGIFVAFIVVISLSELKPSRKIAVFLILGFSLALIIGILFLTFPTIITFYLGRIFTSSLASSSGGRTSGWALAWSIFREHPLLGIGAGAYVAETGGTASNVTLELLATIGVLGCATFYLIPISLIRGKSIGGVIRAFTIAAFVFLIVLQANQNYLRLYYWLHIGITAGMIARKEGELRKGLL